MMRVWGGPRVGLGGFFLACAGAMMLGACGGEAEESSTSQPAATAGFELPADPTDYRPLPGFTAMQIPDDNPMTLAKAELGWKLFFDSRLSGDGSRSCYSCHLNDKGLSDGRPTAIGAFEKKLTRNSPTLWNIGFHSAFYWDNRAPSLEKQAAAAWKGGNMGAKERVADILATLNGIEEYAAAFQAVFGSEANEDNVAKALACFMRTIISRATPWDRYLDGDAGAVSDAAKRGHEVFKKAKCDNCHGGRLFTDMQTHNVGIGMDRENPDLGRGKVTKQEKDMGAFKTPTLRDVVDSGPYFHDGSVADLEDAVRLMLDGGIQNPHIESKELLDKREVSAAEFADLMEFLRALDEPSVLPEPDLP